MAQEMVRNDQQATSIATSSATPFSLESMEKLVPDWLGRDMFDGDFALPASIPADGPSRLRRVAERFSASLEQRPTSDELDMILGGLRLRTNVKKEHAVEAASRFEILKSDCAKHCTEAIREAALTYAHRSKFFPAGYSELAPYIVNAENRRSARRHQLLKAAAAAEKELSERKRLADDPVDPAEVAALVKEMEAAAQMQSSDAKRRDYSNLRMPSAAELADLAYETKKKGAE